MPREMTALPIMIPIYKGDPHGRAVISLGIHLYDLLSHERDIPHYFTSGSSKTLAAEPRLARDGLTGSALFYDHQIVMPERLVMENIVASRESGARLLNYTQLERIEEQDRIVRVHMRDTLTGHAASYDCRVLINAAGPWIDTVRAACGVDHHKVIHPTKGIHLVLPKLSDQALFIASRDNRMFFIIPLGAYSLIGTTDTLYTGSLDEVHADRSDVDYLLTESKRVLPGLDLSRGSVLYTYAGVRPLAFAGPQESAISRKHRVLREGRHGRIITIAGGKLTTYRNMAKAAVDAACRVLSVSARCNTEKTPLPGSLAAEYDLYLQEEVPLLSSRFNVSPDVVRHLISLYGSRAHAVLDITGEDPGSAQRISSEGLDIFAQVVYSIRHEEAKTLSDIVLRRTGIGITGSRGTQRLPAIAEVAAREAGWSREEAAYHREQCLIELRKEVACLKDEAPSAL